MSTIERPAVVAEDEWYVWPHEVDWRFYSRMLRLRGESRVPRIVYLDGDLFLMTPSQPHEERKERLGRLVGEVVVELGMSYRPTGSTTWRRSSKKGGVEGDLTFYIASVDRIRGKKEADLRIDPPPDLAVEVVFSHGVKESLEVYRRLGVPEVWVATERAFQILALEGRDTPEARYEPSSHSLSFPFLSSEEIADWMDRPAPDDDEAVWCRELRAWIRQTLIPRVHDR